MAADHDLTRNTVAFLATNGVEQVELTQPWESLRSAGATVHLVSNTDEVQAYNGLEKGERFSTDRPVGTANPSVYDVLVLPGGVANPDALRTDPEAVALVRGFVETGKIIAAICHAPWTLIEAGAVEGRRLTSWPSLQTDLRNAGATWIDEPVVLDHGSGDISLLITSRNPGDIPSFVDAISSALTEVEVGLPAE